MGKCYIPKPKTVFILWKMRSRHPLSVFSTIVALPYLHSQAICSDPKKKTRQQKFLKQKPCSIAHLSAMGTSVCVRLIIVTPGSGSSNTSLTCKTSSTLNHMTPSPHSNSKTSKHIKTYQRLHIIWPALKSPFLNN